MATAIDTARQERKEKRAIQDEIGKDFAQRINIDYLREANTVKAQLEESQWRIKELEAIIKVKDERIKSLLSR